MIVPTVASADIDDRSPRVPAPSDYALAQRFAGSKLRNMLFSTTVDPHWTPDGNAFWYSYKTGEGTKWYFVDPAKGSRTALFDHDKLAAQLTEIVRDPYTAANLPIRNLEPSADGRTFTFEVTSSQDAKADTTANAKKPAKGEKEVFYFSYDRPNRPPHSSQGQEEGKQSSCPGLLFRRTAKRLSTQKTSISTA